MSIPSVLKRTDRLLQFIEPTSIGKSKARWNLHNGLLPIPLARDRHKAGHILALLWPAPGLVDTRLS